MPYRIVLGHFLPESIDLRDDDSNRLLNLSIALDSLVLPKDFRDGVQNILRRSLNPLII